METAETFQARRSSRSSLKTVETKVLTLIKHNKKPTLSLFHLSTVKKVSAPKVEKNYENNGKEKLFLGTEGLGIMVWIFGTKR